MKQYIFRPTACMVPGALLLCSLGLAQRHLYTVPGHSPTVGLGGDFDQDGNSDLLLAVADRSGGDRRVLVLSGHSTKQLFSLSGIAAGDGFGGSVAAVGDVNNDGVPDIAVGAVKDSSFRGYARVLCGKSGRVLWTVRGDAANDWFGSAVGAIGDLDRDGYADFFVAAAPYILFPPRPGYVRLFSGKTGRPLRTHTGLHPLDGFGGSVSAGHDVDGDKWPDLAIGTRPLSLNPRRGYLSVFSGKTGALIWRLQGAVLNDQFAYAVALLGDLNSDGCSELAVSRFQTPTYVRVYSGRTRKVFFTIPGKSNNEIGYALSGIDDVSGDKVPDLLVAALTSVLAFSGKDGTPLFEANGTKPADYFGSQLTRVGDLNADGNDGLAAVASGGPYVRWLSGRELSLSTDSHQLSPANGGNQRFDLHAGQTNAHKLYLLLGTASGTKPGIKFRRATLPLNADLYWLLALAHPNGWIRMSLGALDAGGNGSAELKFPRNTPFAPSTALHHAFVVLESPGLTVTFARVPAPLFLAR